MTHKLLLPIICHKLDGVTIGLTIKMIEQAPDPIQIALLHLSEGQNLISGQIFTIAMQCYARAIRRGKEADRRRLATKIRQKLRKLYPRLTRWGDIVYRRCSGYLSDPNAHKPFYKFWIRRQYYRQTSETWQEMVTRTSKGREHHGNLLNANARRQHIWDEIHQQVKRPMPPGPWKHPPSWWKRYPGGLFIERMSSREVLNWSGWKEGFDRQRGRFNLICSATKQALCEHAALLRFLQCHPAKTLVFENRTRLGRENWETNLKQLQDLGFEVVFLEDGDGQGHPNQTPSSRSRFAKISQSKTALMSVRDWIRRYRCQPPSNAVRSGYVYLNGSVIEMLRYLEKNVFGMHGRPLPKVLRGLLPGQAVRLRHGL